MQKKSEWSILGGEQKKERNTFPSTRLYRYVTFSRITKLVIMLFTMLSTYFHTKEQAEEAARRVKEVLRKFHEEIGE